MCEKCSNVNYNFGIKTVILHNIYLIEPNVQLKSSRHAATQRSVYFQDSNNNGTASENIFKRYRQ